MRKILIALALLVALATAGWMASKSATWQWTGEIIHKIETDRKVVALTFDDGPSPDETDEVLQILKDHDIKATFYLNGDQMALHGQLAPKIVKAGHELGNHGYTHRRMALRTPNDLRVELTRTNEAIRSAGYEGEITFRPPFGQKLVSLPKVLKEMGMINVMWSVDPMSSGNWSAPASVLTEFTLEKTGPGDIILLHPMFKTNREVRRALPSIIQGLKEQGYSFVTVSTLLDMR